MEKKPEDENKKELSAAMADFQKKFDRYTQAMLAWAQKVQAQRDRKSGESS